MRARTHTRQKKQNLRQVKEDMVPTLSLSRSDVLFRLLYAHTYVRTYIRTHERERERRKREERRSKTIRCACVCAHVALAIQTRRCVYVLFFSLSLSRCFFFARPRKQTSVIRYAYKRSSFGSRSTTMKRSLSLSLSLPMRDETKSDNEEATADRLIAYTRLASPSRFFESGGRER